MEIRVYDPQLDLRGIIENQTSLIWRRKYFEPGEFELYAPITSFNLQVLIMGNLITMYGQDDAGVIEDVKCEENPQKNGIVVKGRFLAAYMERRLIKGTVMVSGPIEQTMRSLLEGVTPIPLLEMGNLQGFPEEATGQITYKNLLKFMEKLARAGNLGFRFRPDFNKKKIVFEVYKGVDRSIQQTKNNRVTFSENYDNLNQATYRANDQNYANVAYVLGVNTEDKETIVVTGETEAVGLERREMYVDASGINAADFTPEEFQKALEQEGKNALDEKRMSETFECDTEANGNFVYRKNYDLGDIVTVKKASWRMQRSLRITELQETYEYGSMVVTPTLGNPLPTAIDWEG